MQAPKILAIAAALLIGAAGAQAALVDRGGGMIYDTTLNITWLADMNYAKTSGYDADGLMNWNQAVAWANNLVYGGFDDWRLPTINPSDTSCSRSFNPGGGFPLQYINYNCTGGELSHLFVADLGNRAMQSVLDPTDDTAAQLANLALFSNVQSYDYWSGTTYAPLSDHAWLFRTRFGGQNYGGQGSELHAVAVRTGDVAAAVPEPQTLTLALLALGAATALLRNRRPTRLRDI